MVESHLRIDMAFLTFVLGGVIKLRQFAAMLRMR
jgi:hypothetical protein